MSVGYEIANEAHGYNHFISNKREWKNCFIKNNQEILLDLAYFALQEQPEDNFMVTFLGAYTMAAKPIKSLELHYTMIQFLITVNVFPFRVYIQPPSLTFLQKRYVWELVTFLEHMFHKNVTLKGMSLLTLTS